MEIQYLKLLRDNPKRDVEGFHIEGLTISEIQSFEQLYNNGNPFPIALKEYLFLAGKYNWTFEMDDLPKLRSAIQYEANFANFTLPSRPFLVIGVDNGGGGSHFKVVFLDEQLSDPKVYFFNLYEDLLMEVHDMERIEDSGFTLSKFIMAIINNYRNMQSKGIFDF